MAWVRCCGGSSKKKFIYDDGTLYIGVGTYQYTVNGGAAPTAGGSLENTGTSLRFKKTGYTGVTSWISDEIDVTNINSITIDVSGFSSVDSYFAGVTNSGLVNNYIGVNQITINSTGLFTIDTSALTGNYRLYIILYASNSSTHTLDASSISLN